MIGVLEYMDLPYQCLKILMDKEDDGSVINPILKDLPFVDPWRIPCSQRIILPLTSRHSAILGCYQARDCLEEISHC